MDKANRKRSEILDAACKVFSEKGYHRTRIEDIASELGMAQGLLYRYFRSKLDIFSQLIDDVIARVTAGIASDAPGTSDNLDQYTEQMRRGVENLFNIFVEDPRISKLLFQGSLGIDEDIRLRIQYLLDLFGEYSSLYVRQGIDKGFLRPDIQVEETGLAFNALIAEGTRRILRADDKEEAKRRWTKAIVDLMIHGTAKGGSHL
jgi:AcrR family transcriptional regulator